MPQKIYKTGIYARLSREDADRMESNSIQSQRAICLAYIENHDDLELVDTYIDDGETGSNTDRPGFQRMIQDMRSGRIDCAVSKDLSRFSRNYIDAGNYLEKIFPAMGIPISPSTTTTTAWRPEAVPMSSLFLSKTW